MTLDEKIIDLDLAAETNFIIGNIERGEELTQIRRWLEELREYKRKEKEE